MACSTFGISAAEAAKLLGISLSHFFVLKRTGRLGPAPVRMGRSTRYDCTELEKWFAAGSPPRAKWEALKNQRGQA